jgi:hypothetical protein
MSRGSAAVRLALLWPLAAACIQPDARGSRSASARSPDGSTDVSLPSDLRHDGAGLVAGDAPPDRSPEPDAPPEPPDRPADAGVDPPAPECQRETRSCSEDGASTRICSDGGRWVFDQTCPPATVCSAGHCLCGPESCREAVLGNPPGGVERMVTGGRSIFYVTRDDYGITIRDLDLITEYASSIDFDFRAYDASTGLVADPTGTLTWCRVTVAAPGEGDLVRGAGELLEQVRCTDLRLSATHVYLVASGLYRRRLGQPGLERVVAGAIGTFELTADHIYFTRPAEQGPELARVPLADLGRPETMAVRPGPLFERIAVDDRQVYLTSDDALLRVAAAGGPLEVIWRPEDARVEVAALSATHVYFATSSWVGEVCGEARLWRLPRTEGGPAAMPTLLSAFPGFCARDLLIRGDRLFLAVSAIGPGSGPAQIVRLRL